MIKFFGLFFGWIGVPFLLAFSIVPFMELDESIASATIGTICLLGPVCTSFLWLFAKTERDQVNKNGGVEPDWATFILWFFLDFKLD